MASFSSILSTLNRASALYGDLRGTLSTDDDSSIKSGISRDGLDTDSESGEDTLPATQVVEYASDDGFGVGEVVMDDLYENVTGAEVDRYYEPGAPSLIRTPDGVELLRTTREKTADQRFYLKTAAVRARGYSDFQDLRCGSNGCVYNVYSASQRARVALKVGNVSGDEVVRHTKAAQLGLAPPLIDSFPVAVGLFDKSSGFAQQLNQFAIVMSLMTPINGYIEAHGVTESLVNAWRALVDAKNRGRMYHGDWHWGNVVLDVAPQRTTTGLAPRVLKMLLIDWDGLVSVRGARPATLEALLRLDAVCQYSQFLTAAKPVSLVRQKLAVKGGMLRYFLGQPLRNAKTSQQALRKTLQFARQLAIDALNASNGSNDSARLMRNDELFAFSEFKFANFEPIRLQRDSRTGLITYS